MKLIIQNVYSKQTRPFVLQGVLTSSIIVLFICQLFLTFLKCYSCNSLILFYFLSRHLKPGYGDLGTTPGSLRNDEPQQNLQKPGATSSLPQYPTGLVTVLGGTHVKDGATTVFETKVIGTYIEGKYAQILQSTSQIIFPAKSEELSTPKPSPTKSVFQKSASPTVTSSRPVPTKPIKNLDQSSRNYRPTAGSNAKEYKATTIGR